MASVIYLTDTRFGQQAWKHPSARHRCYHYADALLALGHTAAVAPLDRVSDVMLKRFDHAIFHRPIYSKRFERVFNSCLEASVRTHVDYDDLIFDPDVAKHSPLFIEGARSIEKVEDHFRLNMKAASYFDSFISSTRFLAERLRQLFPIKHLTILPNSLPRLFTCPVVSRFPDDIPTIGYYPGSNGHGEDFKLVKPALLEVLNDSNARLLIAGRLNQRYYSELSDVHYVPFTTYNNYLSLLARVDVSIAPLVDNVFSQCKSAVKLIESVAVGTPIVATSIQDVIDHSNSMSVVVHDKNQWQQCLTKALTKVVSNAEPRGEKVKTIAAQFSVNNRVPVLLEHLQCVA